MTNIIEPTAIGQATPPPLSGVPAASWVQHLFMPEDASMQTPLPPATLANSDSDIRNAEADVRRLRDALAAAQLRLDGLRHHPGQAEDVQRCQAAQGHPVLRPVLTCTWCKKTGHKNFNGIGGCPGKYPCSICGDLDHNGKYHRKYGRKTMPVKTAQNSGTRDSSACASSYNSAPSSPRSQLSDQGEPMSSSDELHQTGIIQPDKSVQHVSQHTAAPKRACDVAQPTRQFQLPSVPTVPEKSTGGSARQEERISSAIKPGYNAYGRPIKRPRQPTPVHKERSSEAQGDSQRTGQSPVQSPRPTGDHIPAFYKGSGKSYSGSNRRHRPPDLKPDLFPYRQRPGCSCCGDQETDALWFTPVVYEDAGEHQLSDGYKHVSLCSMCVQSRPAWTKMFTTLRMYHDQTGNGDDGFGTTVRLAMQQDIHSQCMVQRHEKYRSGKVRASINVQRAVQVANAAVAERFGKTVEVLELPTIPSETGPE